MYLKRMDIKGFKSFADNTELQLHPGLNIVVGPNGCGKSNIVDAIRWVLGETSIRQLRGQKSEDVIFNGSDKKKALGMAFVELVIDNSDHSLPLEFNEITLGRKVHRSGESEFYLNKSRVRLKDISDLLIGSGVGKKGYAIISQGELEEVLNGQALDRRLMLEEAAGVIKYRQQRDEVKKRILQSSNDLLRLADILEELDIRRQELFKKAEKTQLYLALNSECQELEKSVLRFELARAEKDWQQKTGDLFKKQEDIKAQAGQLGLLEAKLREEEEGLARQQLKLGSLGEERHLIESRLNSLQGEIRLGEERTKNNNERIDNAAADLKKYLALLENIQRDFNLCSVDYDTEQQNMAQRTAEYSELEHEVQEMQFTIEGFKTNFDEKKALVFDKMKQESQLKNELGERVDLLGKAKEKKERLKIHIEELAAKLQKGRKGHLQFEEEIHALRAEIAQKQAFIEEYSQEKNQLAEVLHSLNERYRELNQRSIEINNQLLAIKDLQRNLIGYSPAVKAILKQAQSGRLKGIIGLLGEILEVPAGMELAIDVAAGSGLQNIVVASEKEVREAIDYLKAQERGRATFLPLDVLKVQPLPRGVVEKTMLQDGVLGLASRLVHYDKKFEKAVEYLLGRVLLVEDLPRGIRIFRESSLPCRIVSLDGELINVSGAITGGKKASPTQTPLQRRGEEKKLLLQQQENQKARDDNRREQGRIESRWQELEQSISQARNDLLESQFRCDMLLKQKEDLAHELLEDERERDGYMEQISRLDGEVAEVEREIITVHQKLGDIEQENQKAMRDLENFKDKMEVERRDYEVFKERLLSHKKQLDMKGRELENIRKNLAQFEQLRVSYQQSRDDSQKLIESLQSEIGLEERRIEQFKKEHVKKTEDQALLSAERQQLQEEEKGSRGLMEKYRQEIIPARESLARLETGVRNLEVAIARLEVEMEGLKNRWWEKFAMAAEALEDELLTPGEIREARKSIAVLQQKLEAIGSVDMDSIREYEEIHGRYDFIKQQYDDLSSARDSLDGLLQKTEKLMLQDFSRFLLLANESFKNTFNEIFGGGEAKLRLEADGDRLEAGIDIEVKMPGKRSQSLNLLSGGERALTCIAFIFSLLRLRPVPFCVLDEIDASLDEVNLQRFSRFITAMSRNLQFIVITHRQATIESGENIYGITMPEEGVSAVLTLNVFEAESLAG